MSAVRNHGSLVKSVYEAAASRDIQFTVHSSDRAVQKGWGWGWGVGGLQRGEGEIKCLEKKMGEKKTQKKRRRKQIEHQ